MPDGNPIKKRRKMKETWKQIREAPDYEVSNLGDVRKISDGRLLKQSYSVDGYLRVKLRLGINLRITRNVHRLVMLTFNPPSDEGLDVNHIDGVKTNNALDNLEWCTRQQNVIHSYQMGLASNKGERHPRAKFKDSDIPDILELRRRGFTLKEIAQKYGVHLSTIGKITTNKNWSC